MKLINFDRMHESMKESSGSASEPFLILSASDLLPAWKGEAFRTLTVLVVELEVIKSKEMLRHGKHRGLGPQYSDI
jgi:hypothetical protein